ncbi:DUF885 family protein [Rhodanobacter sp. DHB23]|uniref:DUF885 domain-containing protein n=1 Tax=Rhodanobacter sp. DHB23 TaxID=2775923 RepID=UPI001CE08BF9|nr:DUF885 family protein [Rhodanobacter sp. DHB23]
MPHARHDESARRLRAICAREWAWRRREFAGADEEDNDALPADHLPRVDPDAQATRERRWADTLHALDRLDADALEAEDKINLAVHRHQVESLHDDQRFRSWQMPLTSDSAFWSNLGYTARRPLHDLADAERYLGLLDDIPRWFAGNIANMRAGLARGFSLPRTSLGGHETSIAAIVHAGDESNLLFTPLRRLPSNIAPAAQARLREAALRTIRDAVIPAHARLLDFMRGEYIPQARSSFAAGALPDGADYYRAQIRKFTTLDLGPEAIHALGRDEVAKLHAEMDRCIRDTGFKGDFAAFQHYLRSDPRFYAKSADELLKQAAWIANRVNGVLGQWIGRLPRRRFEIMPVPDELAPSSTFGRGGAGYYLVNTWNLPARPLYALTALTLHEAAPGHALQMPLAAEREDLPPFRRQAQNSAYTEGWALYSERLGVEMGLYETPWDHFGYLGFQMWRACRLVVDTGLHHGGWSRDEACAYLREHTTLAEHEIGTEVDRYIAWPGQALSYYLGQLAFLDARAQAERALGGRFDIRAFHDAVLAPGPVPLPVLGLVTERFVAGGGRSPWPATR